MANSARLKTEISKVFCCTFDDKLAKFQDSLIGIGDETPEHLSRFDELFKGGILLQQGSPLTLLITGPQGSGKSTLALELCYRCANPNSEDLCGYGTLYISTDSETEQVIANAESFGWSKVKDKILSLDLDYKQEIRPPMVLVWGKDKIKQWKLLSQIVKGALGVFERRLKVDIDKKLKEKISNTIQTLPIIGKTKRLSPHILVIDSLNIVEPEERGEYFQKFLKTAPKTTKIIIFVLDSTSSYTEHRFWEYVCDIVVRLDCGYVQDYYVRTIEIQKARYQEHIWGKHQLKIYPKFEMPPSPKETSAGSTEGISEQNKKLRRAHPYRKEGGIFIFPSIHYYLSLYKRLTPKQSPTWSDTVPGTLNKILKGLPEGRCTAFIGCRGGHKSHLAYLHLLHRIIKYQESGLVVSLRDDEEMTKQTMRNILRQEFPEEPEVKREPEKLLENLEYENQLEILYYPPGYITSEEFFHRMFVSIHRLKHKTGFKRLSVLFNSLDQLGARFPLCAKQEIFIPGIIECLSGEGITSIFIAVEEPGQPAEQYGLLPMADLILSFHSYQLAFQDYYKHLDETREFHKKDEEFQQKVARILEASKDGQREEILLRVVRFAGGQRAGARGLLELVDEDKVHESLYSKAGLYFTQLSEKFSHGEPIGEGKKEGSVC